MNRNTVSLEHLDHAVRTGLISAGVIGLSIGILYGLTHSVQIGAALIDAIDLYGDSSGVTFDTGSPMIASVVSIIPAVIGGLAGAGAPIGATTLGRWLKLSTTVQLLAGLVIAIAGGAAAGVGWIYNENNGEITAVMSDAKATELQMDTNNNVTTY